MPIAAFLATFANKDSFPLRKRVFFVTVQLLLRLLFFFPECELQHTMIY